jgi:type I restriction enzyme S subunit
VSDLPLGWAKVSLHSITAQTLGGDWGKGIDDHDSHGVRVGVVRGTEFKSWSTARAATAATRFIKPASLEKRRLSDGDLVVEISGGGPQQPVGRVLRIDGAALASCPDPLVCSNFCRQLRIVNGIDSGFVELALKYLYATGKLDEIQTSTTNLRNLDFGAFLALDLPLAPLAEQHRIVEKVAALLEQVNHAKARFDRVPLILKRFRQSVLAAACAGELTREWRAENPANETGTTLINHLVERSERKRRYPTGLQVREDLDLPDQPNHWAWADLRFLCEPSEALCYGVVQPGDECETGVPLIRAGDLHDLPGSLAGLRTISKGIDELYGRSRLLGGEILVTVVGANIGTVALAPTEARGFNIARAVAKLPIREVVAEYVLLWLQSPLAYRWMFGDAREVARPTLNIEQLETLPVPVPPLHEQQRIVRCVGRLFRLADAIEHRVRVAMARAEKLPQAVLSKAFSGELVPTEAELARAEGRPYESADELLKQVTAPNRKTRATERSLPTRRRRRAG